jgi:L-lactate dehydrogenase complex protein LldF
VKINLHEQLLTWRREIVHLGLLSRSKRLAMQAASFVMRRPWLFAVGGRMARTVVPLLPRWVLYNRLNPWGLQRELPPFPKQSFREQYRARHE